MAAAYLFIYCQKIGSFSRMFRFNKS